MACLESIQPFWISREPVVSPWCNLAASQRRHYCASVNSHSPVGLVSRQWDAVDWAYVLCDRRIHNDTDDLATLTGNNIHVSEGTPSEACPESIQTLWISREPFTWPWCNLATNQRERERSCCASVNSHSPVGLASWQWDAVDWACLLCDRCIHNDPASRTANLHQCARPFYSSHTGFFWQTSHQPGLSAPLKPRFVSLRLLVFPKAKTAVEKKEICECNGHTVHKLSQRRLTADWLAPRESDCSRMHSKVSSDSVPSYIKATRPVLEIFKTAGYFPDSPRAYDVICIYWRFVFTVWVVDLGTVNECIDRACKLRCTFCLISELCEWCVWFLITSSCWNVMFWAVRFGSSRSWAWRQLPSGMKFSP